MQPKQEENKAAGKIKAGRRAGVQTLSPVATLKEQPIPRAFHLSSGLHVAHAIQFMFSDLRRLKRDFNLAVTNDRRRILREQ